MQTNFPLVLVGEFFWHKRNHLYACWLHVNRSYITIAEISYWQTNLTLLLLEKDAVLQRSRLGFC